MLSRYNVRYFTEVVWRIGKDSDFLKALADSGCVQVLMGIESLNTSYQGMGKKQAEIHEIMDAVDTIQDAGIAVNGCFIIGGDDDNRQSIDRLEEFILQSRLADVQVTLLTPFPGTALYEKLQKQKRLLPDRKWLSYTLFDVAFQPVQMTVSELEKAFRNLLSNIFNAKATTIRETIKENIWRKNPTFGK